MSSQTICGKCRLPVHKSESGVRNFGTHIAHSEERCLYLLTAKFEAIEQALHNCYMLARREVAGEFHTTDPWKHIVRFCESVGLTPNILRAGIAEIMDTKQHDAEQYQLAVQIVRQSGNATISHLQRTLKLGYNRCARLMEAMEHDGIVGPLEPLGARKVIE